MPHPSAAFDLTGKTALITGASRGLGRHFALTLAQAGADVAITSRTIASLADTAKEIEQLGRKVLSVELDVRDHASIAKAVEQVHGRFGPLNILVNNAGCNVRKPALDVSWDDWNLILDTNLRGPFFVAQSIATLMMPHG